MIKKKSFVMHKEYLHQSNDQQRSLKDCASYYVNLLMNATHEDKIAQTNQANDFNIGQSIH